MLVQSKLTIMMAAAIILSGCVGSNDDGGDDPAPTDPVDDGMGGDNETMTPPAAPRIVTFNATNLTGIAPFEVNFTVDASGDDNLSWILGFGDGEAANGTAAQLPGTFNHTYTVAGNFSANLTVTYSDGQTAEANLTIDVALGVAPIQEYFEYNHELIGCEPTITGTCISRDDGPGADPVDGVWVPLDDRYWGLAFTSTVATNGFPDSDCWFVKQEGSTFTNMGSANNNQGPCQGTVPDGVQWIFVYPYAEPATQVTVTFTS